MSPGTEKGQKAHPKVKAQDGSQGSLLICVKGCASRLHPIVDCPPKGGCTQKHLSGMSKVPDRNGESPELPGTLATRTTLLQCRPKVNERSSPGKAPAKGCRTQQGDR